VFPSPNVQLATQPHGQQCAPLGSLPANSPANDIAPHDAFKIRLTHRLVFGANLLWCGKQCRIVIAQVRIDTARIGRRKQVSPERDVQGIAPGPDFALHQGMRDQNAALEKGCGGHGILRHNTG
jgi:hypothetical protein